MRDLGWTEGGNLRIDFRWAEADTERLRAYAAELIRSKPDLIVAHTGSGLAAVRAVGRPTGGVRASVGSGGQRFRVEPCKPGGNITGFTTFEYSMGGKWLEMLKEIAPKVDAGRAPDEYAEPQLDRMADGRPRPFRPPWVCRSPVPACSAADEFEPTISAFARETNGALLLPPTPSRTTHRDAVVARCGPSPPACDLRIRDIGWRAGGLMSYGLDLPHSGASRRVCRSDSSRNEARQICRSRPPTKFELVINLKTAKALGLDVPPMLLARADEVIE